MKLKLQPREKLIATATVLLISVYCFYTGWYLTYVKKINMAKAELIKTTIKLNSTRSLLANKQNYSTRSAEIETEAAFAEQQLPSVAALPYVLGYIRRTFENNGVALKNISYTKGNAQPGVDSALEYRTAKISFCGTYPQIVAALQSLETSDQGTLTISDLTLVKSDNGLLNGGAEIGMYFTQRPQSDSENKPIMGEKGKFTP